MKHLLSIWTATWLTLWALSILVGVVYLLEIFRTLMGGTLFNLLGILGILGLVVPLWVGFYYVGVNCIKD